MKYKNNIQKLRTSLLMTTAFVLAASPSFAVDLMAVEGTWTSSAGGAPVPMWGFAADAGSCPGAPGVWSVGPELTAADLVGGDLTINLRNCLSEPVSIMISGQNAVYSPPVRNAEGRITAFTKEALPGGTASYTWTGVSSNPGTYLYMSGSHPAKQVHMGLYGALKVGQYPGTSADLTLLYSEIDPVLHNSGAAATPLTYKPRHFLVNGVEEVTLAAGDTSQPTVLSFLNAGLDFHVPALNKGYMSLKAEDGNPYPYSKEEYSVKLAPGKTIEAFWLPAAEGEHVIYDRSGNGMVAKLTVGPPSGGTGPAVADDAYSVDEDIELVVAVGDGVTANDDPGFSVELVTGTSAGALSCPAGGFLCSDGSFNYQPNADFNGSDSFTYKTVAMGGTPSSSVATVTITVNPINDAPVAADDAYEAVTGVALNIAAPGVLVNDLDIDGDALTVTASTLPDGFNPDGSFTIAAPVAGVYSYTVCDSAPLCDTADVTITVGNDIPVAVDDFTTVRRNSTPDGTVEPDDAIRNTFSVVANDTDANGIDATSVFIIGQDGTGTAITSQGGTVVNNGDGTVSYTPKAIWAGTDTFAYVVRDTIGELSNQATVRINVVRKRDLPPLP